jgi:UDP-glucose 4-epimerase
MAGWKPRLIMADVTRALVTGGAGFIGSHLVDALLREGAERVIVVDNLFLGTTANLEGPLADGRVHLYREDAADADAMRSIVDAERPGTVFNLATKALLYSFFNPAGACRVNLDVALVLCELQRLGGFQRLVHVSSSEVYGTAQFTPMLEDHPLLAETTYAAGKAAADLAVASYVRMFDLDSITVRPFNNYGPRQNAGAFAAVIPATVNRCLGGLPPFVTGDGQQTRDFIFVDDTVDAIVRAARLDDARGAVVNVASGRETAILDLVTRVAELVGWTGEIEHQPERPADVHRHWADVSAAHALIGPIARTSLEDGLARTVDWYLEQAGGRRS